MEICDRSRDSISNKEFDMKFICVFDENAKNKLLDAKFMLLTEDTYNRIFFFENMDHLNETQNTALDSVSYILTNTLTF